jgi:hypothetical protein
MTCREFKHSAEALTLWELSRTQDEAIVSHARQCESCGSWLREQRSLAASLQTLQARTAGLEAGADVERALLRAFRQNSAQDGALSKAPSTAGLTAVSDAPPDGVRERISPLRSIAAPISTPFALRLSRWFEVGAYAAVAAAIVVVMFLGVRILEDRSRPLPAQAQSAPASVSPTVQTPVAAAQTTTSSTGLASVSTGRYLRSANRSQVRVHPVSEAAAATQTVAAQEPPTDTDDGYEALMFCDPLSCATDSQVVRMELPAQSGQGVKTADLVVGYDGVVRAVRIVN